MPHSPSLLVSIMGGDRWGEGGRGGEVKRGGCQWAPSQQAHAHNAELDPVDNRLQRIIAILP